MSPEQVRGIDIDQRTDVFSLGITMWEMFTRQRLFQAENELLVLEKIRNFTVPPPSSVDPSLPPKLDEIVLKALAKNPSDRYQSCKELYRDLNILAQSANANATREDIAAYMQRAFPEAVEPTGTFPTPSRPAGGVMSYNPESSTMAGANDKRGDLDIFEGLGKKGTPAPSGVTPPPPPSRNSGPPQPPLSDIGKKTLMGIAGPAGNMGGSPVQGRPPPPPSGGARSTNPGLPPPAAPPARSSYPPAPPPVATKPAPYGVAPPPQQPPSSGSGGMDMDWDDEDEATHIFDKENESKDSVPAFAAPKPAAGMPAIPPPASSPPRPPPPVSPLGQTFANNGPPPPPPGRSAPPPPPSSVGSSFARASGQVASSGPLINQQALGQQQQMMTMPLGQNSPLSGQLHTSR